MTRILRVPLFVVARLIAVFSESRIFAGYTDFADYCLNRGLSRITQMTRILRGLLLVVVRLIAAFFESRILRITRIGKYLLMVAYLHACLNRGLAQITRMTRIDTL